MEQGTKIIPFNEFIHLDEDGIPTDDFLNYIATAKIEGTTELLDFINFSIKPALVHIDSLQFNHNGLIITTMGHSTNEVVVEAMLKNIYLTHISMTYSKWQVGGKFIFNIKYQ